MMHLRCLPGCEKFKLLGALSVATLLLPLLMAQAQPFERPRPPRSADDSGSRTRDELLRTLAEMQKTQKQIIDLMTENQKKMEALRQRLQDMGRRSETPRPDVPEGRDRRGPPAFGPDFRERMERFRRDRQREAEKPPAVDKPSEKPAERKPSERKPSERRRPTPESKPDDVEQRLERLLRAIEEIRKELKEAKGQQ